MCFSPVRFSPWTGESACLRVAQTELRPKRVVNRTRASSRTTRSGCRPWGVIDPSSQPQEMRQEGRSEQNDVHTVFDCQACQLRSGPDHDCDSYGHDSGSNPGIRDSSVQEVHRQAHGEHQDEKHEERASFDFDARYLVRDPHDNQIDGGQSSDQRHPFHDASRVIGGPLTVHARISDPNGAQSQGASYDGHNGSICRAESGFVNVAQEPSGSLLERTRRPPRECSLNVT